MTVTPQHIRDRAAALLGRGLTKRAVAEEVGVAYGTVKSWAGNAEFQAAVRRERERALNERPTARAVLEAALHARLRDGSPDWTNRVKAAALLLKEPPEPEEEKGSAVVIRVYEDGREEVESED